MTPVTQNLTLFRGITFDEIIIYCFTSSDFIEIFDITGWTPWAEVRSSPDQTLILDLSPEVHDGVNGIIRIPEIPDEQTFGLPEGKFKWDFLLEDPNGRRFGPYIKGSFKISSKITQGNPPE